MIAVGRPASSRCRAVAVCLIGALSLMPAAAQTAAPAPRAAAASAPKAKPTTPASKSPAKKSAPGNAAAAPGPATKPQTPPPTAAPTPAPNVEGASKLPPLPPIDTTKPPPMLPRAGREKMRACAEEWDDLKRHTKVGELTWRVFATKCLTR